MAEEEVRIHYTNWRGETSWRRIIPRKLYHGTSEFHEGEKYLLDAFDVEKRVMRTFLMEDIFPWVDEVTYQKSLKQAREEEDRKLRDWGVDPVTYRSNVSEDVG